MNEYSSVSSLNMISDTFMLPSQMKMFVMPFDNLPKYQSHFSLDIIPFSERKQICHIELNNRLVSIAKYRTLH